MKSNLISIAKAFAADASPALKAAFLKAAKVGAYLVLSAAIAAAYAFTEKQTFDPTVFAAVNIFLASAKKAVEEFGK